MAERVRSVDLLVVGLGGAVGTAVRVAGTVPHPPHAFPTATIAINVLGAGLLGLLIERLARRPGPGAQRLRLLVGTGLLGGFTTYSALAVDTVLLLRHGETGLAIAYALGTLLLGSLATWLGIVVGRTRRARR